MVCQLNYQPEVFSETSPFDHFNEFDRGELDAWQGETNPMSSERVHWIQQALNKILGLRLKTDGIIGAQTRSAIRIFQQKQGFVVDGVVGPKTLEALKQQSTSALPPNGQPPVKPTHTPTSIARNLVLINRPTDEAVLRAVFVANARSLDGLEAANKEHRAIWEEVLGPTKLRWDLDRPFKVWKDPSGKYQTQGVSTCGLVAEGIWRRMKIDLPALYQPYIPGSAISRAIGFARKTGAWVQATAKQRPSPGDYVVIGEGLQTHVLTCVGWEGDTLVSIDGGQVGQAGLQAIKERRRMWLPRGTAIYLEQRKVIGWVNVAYLAYRNEQVLVPSGFKDSHVGTNLNQEWSIGNGETETGIEIAGVALGGAALGVAVFEVAKSILTSGDLFVTSDTARYVHPTTPATIPFRRKTIEFKISAHHPRYWIDRQNFFFKLSFEYNGYDIRNASISVLRNKSSSLFSSTFALYFNALPYSPESESRTQIAFNIKDGRWDPVGRGDVSFEANPLFVLNANGRIDNGSLVSEMSWVTFDGFEYSTLQDIPLSSAYLPPPQTGNMPVLRIGSRGMSVTDLQIRLNRWLVTHGRQMLVVDGNFGSKTQRVVLEFQQSAGLKADGVVGAKTWGLLKKYW